jgi:hypothetical protein
VNLWVGLFAALVYLVLMIGAMLYMLSHGHDE